MSGMWNAFDDEMRLWREAGLVARLWLRDDDAVRPSDALDRLLALTDSFAIPVLLAVIAASATPALSGRLRNMPLVSVCQHGYAHVNHAAAGAKAAELGADRDPQTILDELAVGRARLRDLFGGSVEPVLVPPWNRIAPSLLPDLPELGFAALSTFGPEPAPPGLLIRNCRVDIIDWKATRRGHRPEKLIGDLVEALADARRAGGLPVGVLTHHLVHGEAAWSFLSALFERTDRHADVRWTSFDRLRQPSIHEN